MLALTHHRMHCEDLLCGWLPLDRSSPVRMSRIARLHAYMVVTTAPQWLDTSESVGNARRYRLSRTTSVGIGPAGLADLAAWAGSTGA